MMAAAFFYFEQIIQDHVTETLPAISYAAQRVQARELLPNSLNMDSLSSFDSEKVLRLVERRLPKKYRAQSDLVARTIIQEAKRNNLDPLFLMAVIQTESGFNPEVRGRHGEIGLMQILPKTSLWLAKRFHLQGEIDLTRPEINIKLGAAYLAKLRKRFHHVGNRYIAAFNMGSKNVHRLLASQVEPRIYPDKVLHHYKKIYSQISSPATKAAVAAL